jgi:hypothetical protein
MLKSFYMFRRSCWALVAHACNPSYSGGRDQEDCDLKPAGHIVPQDLSQKAVTKIGLVEWFKVKALSSSPSTTKKKKKKKSLSGEVQRKRVQPKHMSKKP